jgi:FkbM family methyltransferase
MNKFERLCVSVRHKHWLRDADWFWNTVRPFYDEVVSFIGRNGLERTINGTDNILVSPHCRWVTEVYESSTWTHLMSQVKPGDVVADIGAYIGLYSIAIARRIGTRGKVIAFEPDPGNFNNIKKHVELNNVTKIVELNNLAVGETDGPIDFVTGLNSESHINQSSPRRKSLVDCVTIDTFFGERAVDMIKIDVEGYEEKVLKGGKRIFTNNSLGPRLMYIEVHPYMWSIVGTTSESFLSLIKECNYKALSLNGESIEQISDYGEIVAYKNN